jgi:hypothetical protein
MKLPPLFLTFFAVLPIAADAEQWICAPELGSFIESDKVESLEMSSIFIVDLDKKQYREREGDYKGTCSFNPTWESLFCYSRSQAQVETIHANLPKSWKTGNFSYSFSNVPPTYRNNSRSIKENMAKSDDGKVTLMIATGECSKL